MIEKLKKQGFVGFKTMRELFIDASLIPKIKGVYLILNPNFQKAEFLEIGTGGHFKGKNPNVSIEKLRFNWVDNSLVVYVGQSKELNKRLKQYFAFGQGLKVGHWGGRFIWQLKKSADLIVCWKPLPDDDPIVVENHLIELFVAKYGKRPFANLRD